jgi:hypothetical protein
MAFKVTQLSLQRSFEQLLQLAAQEKIYLANWNTRLAGTITGLDAVEIVNNINRVLDQFAEVTATPGLSNYVKTQFDTPTYDVQVEYAAMRNALIDIRTWLRNNIPSTAISIVNGVPVGQNFGTGATAPLKALVVAAMATID